MAGLPGDVLAVPDTIAANSTGRPGQSYGKGSTDVEWPAKRVVGLVFLIIGVLVIIISILEVIHNDYKQYEKSKQNQSTRTRQDLEAGQESEPRVEPVPNNQRLSPPSIAPPAYPSTSSSPPPAYPPPPYR